MGWLRCICLVIAFLPLATFEAKAAEPRTVLLLHSFGAGFAPWSVVAGRFREELIKGSPQPIDLYEASLVTARFKHDEDEGSFADYLRNVFRGRQVDLVVVNGAPAMRFFQRFRKDLFPSAPLLIMGVEQRNVVEAGNDAVAPVSFHLPDSIADILELLPQTQHIAVTIGDSPLERFWLGELRAGFEQFTSRVTFHWLNGLPFSDMQKRVAALPPNSAIFYLALITDGRGVPHEQDRALSALHAVANAPIFSHLDSAFGLGIVGGPMLSTQEHGLRAAQAGIRILGGENADTLRLPTLMRGQPTYDWRELHRWNIDEARLPPNSIIHFREPSAWQRYRWQLTFLCTALLVLAAMTTALLVERTRRHHVEAESRGRLLQLLHLNRTATAGALSASVAHELSQPLGAIMSNAEAAELLLQAKPPDVDQQLKDILADIRQADQRATDIIVRLRNLLKRRNVDELEQFDVNVAIADTVHILSPEAKKRNITLIASDNQQVLPVRADRVHVQQVILNLVTNGMDAMADAVPAARQMTIGSRLSGRSRVEVVVSDCGTGIALEKLQEVFDPFYTTKKHGTGLGLLIARTIVETYGGKIWAENRLEGGAEFRFTLPLAQGA